MLRRELVFIDTGNTSVTIYISGKAAKILGKRIEIELVEI
jgi:hypothetical protein